MTLGPNALAGFIPQPVQSLFERSEMRQSNRKRCDLCLRAEQLTDKKRETNAYRRDKCCLVLLRCKHEDGNWQNRHYRTKIVGTRNIQTSIAVRNASNIRPCPLFCSKVSLEYLNQSKTNHSKSQL